MNEYIVSLIGGHIDIGSGDKLVLMTATNYLESGGQMVMLDPPDASAFYMIGLTSTPYYCSVIAGADEDSGTATVVIGGNYDEYSNLYYYGKNVQGDVATIKYLIDGAFSFAAQTGAVLDPAAVDADLLISVYTGFEVPSGQIFDQASRVKSVQTLNAWGLYGEKSITLLGSMGGKFQVTTNQNRLSYYQYDNNGTATTVAMISGHSADAAAVRANSITIENNMTGSIEATAQMEVLAPTSSNATVSGNRSVAYGYYATGDFTVGGKLGGTITLLNGASTEDDGGGSAGGDDGGGSAGGGDDGSSGGSGGDSDVYSNIFSVKRDYMLSTDSGTIGTASVSSNTIGGYGVYAGGTITLHEYAGAIVNQEGGATFEVVSENNSSTTATVSYNKVELAGIYGNAIAADSMAGSIESTIANVKFSASGAYYDNCIGNTISNYGIRAGSSLTVTGNLATNITLSTADCSESGWINYSNKYLVSSYGIYAPTITVGGGLSANIAADAYALENLSRESVSVGVYADTLTAGYLGGEMSLAGLADDTCPPRVVGYWVADTLANGNDGVVDFIGNMNLSGSGAYTIGFMGFKESGLNLRVSGSIACSEYAIVAGLVTPDTLYRYGTDDSVEVAAGGSIVGTIELFNGANSLTIDSNASVTGSVSAMFGTLNLTFNLNSKAMGGYVSSQTMLYTVQETLLYSTTTISVNLNDAKIGEEYTIIRLADEEVLEDDWAERELTIYYQGHTGKVYVGQSYADSYMNVTTALTDGVITIIAKELNGDVKSASSVTGVVADEDANTLTFNWDAVSGTEVYELEYKINDGNSIVVWVDGKENKLEMALDSFDAGSVITYRLRQHTSKNYIVSEWSDEATYTVAAYEAKFDEFSSARVDTSNNSTVASAVAELTWNDAKSPFGIDHYNVYYFQSGELLDSYDADDYTVYTKQVTDNAVIISGLNNLEYIYWWVEAVDNSGNVSDPIKGTTVRVYTGDDTPPEFNTSSVYSVVTFNPPESGSGSTLYTMSVTVHWDPAVDVDGKSGLAGYDISYRLADTEDEWVTVHFDASATSGTISGLENGTYEWKIWASDYAGNQTDEYSGSLWRGDYEAPVFYGGENLEVTIEGDGANNNNITLSWNPAIENPESLGFQSGMQKYVLYYKPSDAEDSEAVSVEITDLANSYTFSSKAADLSDGTYTWWVVAYDNVNNSVTSSTSTFTVDSVGPQFQSGGLVQGPYITATWEETTTTNPLGYTITKNEVTAVNVQMIVPAVYSDTGNIYYLFQFSKNSAFTDVVEYKFDYDASGVTTINMSNQLGSGAGALAKMGKVYYRFMAVDEFGNTSGSWVYMNNPFEMVDPSTGDQLVDTDTPTDPSSLAFSISNQTANFSWTGSTDVFGVQYYQIRLSSRNGGASQTISGIDELKYSSDSLTEGKYSWSVRALDWYNHASSWVTADEYIYVDRTAPVFDASSIESSVVNKDIYLSWSAATDNVELDHYEVYYGVWSSASGSYTQWTVVNNLTPKNTSIWFNNMDDGKYAFMVRAVDAAGNTSDWSETQYLSVNTAGDPGSTMKSALTWAVGTPYSGAVGRTDTADYLKYNLASAASVTVSVSDVSAAENNGSGVKVTLLDASGKKLQTVTVKPGSQSTFTTLVDSSAAYICVNPSKSGMNNVADYTVDVAASYFPAATANNSIATATGVVMGSSGKITISGDACWVGYGDAADYYKITGSAAGTVEVAIGDLESGMSVTATLYDANGKKLKTSKVSGNKTVFSNVLVTSDYYVSVESGDKGKGKQNTTYSVSVTESFFPAATDNNTIATATDVAMTDGVISIADTTDCWVGYGDAADYYKVTSEGAGNLTYLALSNVIAQLSVTIYDANGKKLKTAKTSSNGNVFTNILVNGDYYISVESGDKGKGKQNSYYAILGEVNYFPTATDNNTIATATGVSLTDGALTLDDPTTCFVGYGDAADYYLVNGAAAGAATITVSGLEAKVKVAVYNADGKALKSVSASSGSVTISDLLVTQNYYIGIESGDKGKGKQNTTYTVNVTESYFPAATDNNTIATATDVALTDGAAVLNDASTCWVGYGDAADYYKVTGAAAGLLTLSVSGLTAKATVTIYDANGKKLRGSSVSSAAATFSNIMVGSTFYVSVESGDKGKGKQNTNYELNIFDDYYPVATDNNTIATATEVTLTESTVIASTSARECWVGYGDAVDCYKLVGDPCLFNIAISGLTAKVVVTLYDSNGKQVSKVTTNSDKTLFSDVLINGQCYLSVESGDKGKGVQNTDYTLTLNGSFFPTEVASNNTFNTAEEVAVSVSGTSSLQGWVGYCDAVDYFKVTFALDSHTLVSVGNVTDNVILTVYDATGKRLSATTVTEDTVLGYTDFAAGSYYFSLTSYDNGAGKYNTYYNVTLDSKLHYDASANNSVATATAIEFDETGAGAASDAVSYGDLSDYFAFEVAEGGQSISGALALENEDVEFGADLTWTILDSDGNGGTIDAQSFNYDLAAGTYYLRVDLENDSKFTKYSIQLAC